MRKFLAVLICIVLFFTCAFASFTGSYNLFRTPETPIDSSYLMQFTDSDEAYYLQKAAADIIFYIDSEEKEYTSLFTLTDSKGNEMEQLIESGSGVAFKIIPPDSGYEAGGQYSLFLKEDAKFSGNDLREVRELVFTIEKEEVEIYKYTDSLKILGDEDFTFVDENIIDIKDIDSNISDIFINEKANEVYKIVDILDDGTAIVETPGLDEIFSDLQVYGEYTWNLDDIEWNSDLEIEIEDNIRNSSFFDSLMNIAYADEDKTAGVKVNYELNHSDNTIKVEIEITLGPGKDGLFGMSKLKNQEVTISLESLIGLSLYCNIDGFAFDVSATQSNNFSWAVSLDVLSSSPLDKEINAADAIKNLAEYQNVVGELTRKLANVVKDRETGEVQLFKWNMPIAAIPGLVFEAEVLLFTELDIAANLTLGGHSTTRNTAGICFKDYEFRTYSDQYRSKSPLSLSLNGTGELKAGIKIEIRAQIISEHIAYIQIDPQAGLYSEVFVTYPILKSEDMSDAGSILKLYGYFEGGLYFGANFKAAVNMAFKWYEYEQELIEKKAPIVTMGNDKIALGISSSRPTVRAINNSVTAPDIIFEYYDVTKGNIDSESLGIDDVKFTVNDKELEKSRKQLKLNKENEGSFYVNASYKNPGDNRSYNTLFKVIISGSEMEGRVSEYTSSSEYEPIPNAIVELYGENDLSNAISKSTTDDTGKFSFNVGEGRYVLKISARGYRELTSLQDISKDETKFTEHILLVDNVQRGNGTAGGYIKNAIDGGNLQGVQIRLRENWNNQKGNYFRDFNEYTGLEGQYKIDNLPVGYYTIEASKEGFYTDYCNIIVHATDPKYDQNFTISPILPEDQIRIVLRWGEHPRDLDSHLIGLKPDESSFNVFYRNMRYSWEGLEIVNLDVDDTSSYGPETITILEPMDNWVYAVHDYTNKGNSDSEKMSYSGAYVTVFTGGRQVGTFNIPVGKVGTYWTVFEYMNGEIRPINAVNNTKPSP